MSHIVPHKHTVSHIWFVVFTSLCSVIQKWLWHVSTKQQIGKATKQQMARSQISDIWWLIIRSQQLLDGVNIGVTLETKPCLHFGYFHQRVDLFFHVAEGMTHASSICQLQYLSLYSNNQSIFWLLTMWECAETIPQTDNSYVVSCYFFGGKYALRLYVWQQCVCLLWLRKRPRKEQQQQEEDDNDLTATATPRRRLIKLTSIKELRAEITENTHTGQQPCTIVYLLNQE